MKLARVLAATAVVASTMLTPVSARAQSTETTTPAVAQPAGVSLVSQDSWVPLGGTFTMFLHLDNQALATNPDAAIAIAVHASATTRTAFDSAMNSGDLGGTIYQPNPIPVSSLLRNKHGDVAVVLGLSGSNVEPTIGVRQPGVYPVEVSLTNTGHPTTPFVTWMVAVDTSASPPISKQLMVTWVLPIVAPPMTLPDGTVDPTVAKQMQAHGRLTRIAQVLDHANGVPLSLMIGPETAQSWQHLASTDKAAAASFAHMRDAATSATTELLPAPYVPIDAPSLEAAGLGDHLPDEFVEGNNTLTSAFGTHNTAPAKTAFLDPADSDSVDRLRQMLVDRVLVRDQSLRPVVHPYTPSQTFTITTSTGTSRGAATAPFIESLLNGPDTGALKAARILASLSEVAYEQPALARGIVIAPSTNWTADLATMDTVMAGLLHNPLLRPVTLDRLLNAVPPETGANNQPVERQLADAQPVPPPVSVSDYLRITGEVDAYADVVGAADPTVADARNRLAIALSSAISPDRAQAELARVEGIVHGFTNGITTDAKRITLTSRHAQVPLSFENTIRPKRTVTVLIHLDSPKLSFPKGADELVTLPPGSTTKRIPMEARATGTFPLTITLTSADGRLALGAPVRVTVRSAAFGGFAIGLTVAAVLFLAVWWINHIRRTRRGRRMAATAAVT
jgi:hypothetical protein